MKEKVKEKVKNFLRDETGQSTTEYILILAVVVMIAMKFRGIIHGKLTGILDKVGTEMDQAVSGNE